MTWHIQDKPDALEGIRNNYSQTLTENRNPFVIVQNTHGRSLVKR